MFEGCRRTQSCARVRHVSSSRRLHGAETAFACPYGSSVNEKPARPEVHDVLRRRKRDAAPHARRRPTESSSSAPRRFTGRRRAAAALQKGATRGEQYARRDGLWRSKRVFRLRDKPGFTSCEQANAAAEPQQRAGYLARLTASPAHRRASVPQLAMAEDNRCTPVTLRRSPQWSGGPRLL